MKLLQFYLPEEGVRAGVLDGDRVRDIPSVDASLRTAMDVLRRSVEEDVSMDEVVERTLNDGPPPRTFSYAELDVSPEDSTPHLTTPIASPEVWGFGVTYRRSAVDRDEDSHQDIYTRVYFGERPEVFFKATPSRCVGPNGYICCRQDSNLTAVEPELAYVLGAGREIVGYTICNDVSAWDIERENPLYLTQSKTFLGCCAIGPVLVTTSELRDPYSLNVSCRISKQGKLVYEGEVNTDQIHRRFDELTEYLYRDNPIPAGTAVSTGTGIMVPNELALEEGDLVEIEIEGIGVLSNPVRKLRG